MAEYRERVAFLASAMVKLTLLFLAFALVVIEPVFSNKPTITFDGRRIQFFGFEKTWNEANDICLQNGMRLMTPDSEDQNILLKQEMNADSHKVWIAGSKRGRKEFTWTTTGIGFPVDKDAFLPGQPDNAHGNEACLNMQTTGNDRGFNDSPCNLGLPFFCEDVPKKKSTN